MYQMNRLITALIALTSFGFFTTARAFADSSYIGTCAARIVMGTQYPPSALLPSTFTPSIVQYTDQDGGDCIGGPDSDGEPTYYKIIFQSSAALASQTQARSETEEYISSLIAAGYCKRGPAPLLPYDKYYGGRNYIRGNNFRGLDGSSAGEIPGLPPL